MKFYRNTIILLAVLVLVVGGFVFLTQKKPVQKPDDTGTTESVKVLDLDNTKMKEITIENNGEKLVFKKEKDAWIFASHPDVKFDTSKVENIARNMGSLSADKTVAENATDLKPYGLDKPSSVTVTMEDGKVYTLEVGNQTPLKDGYYARLKDAAKVYTLSSYTGEGFKVSKKDFRDKTIFTMKQEEITVFALERGGKEVFSAESTKVGETDVWNLTSPVKWGAYSVKILPLAQTAIGNTVSEFIEENAQDLQKYGLQNPAYSFTVGSKTEKVKVLVGDEKTRGTDFYCMLAGSKDVFTLPASQLNFLDTPLSDAIDPYAYMVNIQEVTRLVVNIDGKTIDAEIQNDKGGDKDKDKFFVNGKDATVKNESGDSLFRKYYTALIGVRFSMLEMDVKPQGQPAVTFTYTLSSGETVKVEFIPRDGETYYAVRNGYYAGLVVSKDAFYGPEGVLETYNTLVNAMDKK